MRGFADAEAGDYVVDHDRAGMDVAGEAFTAAAGAGPDAGRGSVVGIVGEARGFLFVVEGRDRENRTEGFFPHDAHAVIDVREDGRREESWPKFAQTRTSGQHAGAAFFGVFKVRLDNANLALVDHGAEISGGIESVADAKFVRLGGAGFDEGPIQPSMNVTTLDREAGLARVDEGSPDSAARGYVNIGVVKDEHWVFAAEFEHDRKKTLGGSFCNPATGGYTACKYELVNIALY